MKKFFLTLLIFILASDSGAYAEKRTSPTSTKEEMMEDILFQHYAPQLLKITNKLYECEKILSIKRINNKHLIEVGLTTFTGPHNPPNDFYIITFIDRPIGPSNHSNFTWKMLLVLKTYQMNNIKLFVGNSK